VESDLPANATAVVSALIAYERQILPLARDELRRWEERALAIPDPLLRATALKALHDKGRNVEATAVFGILVPRGRRAGPVRAMTALQAAIDYLDSLSEQAVDDPLADGLALHEALVDAVSPDGATTGDDPYRLHPQGEDGGYLAALVAACRAELATLPATEEVLPLLRRAAKRCGEGQSHTHAAAGEPAAELEAWATELPQPAGYLWWEAAAGASSSVAAHALIAAAADPQTTAEEAGLVDAAYFPPVGALTVLLDDLIDRDQDHEADQHNYLRYFAGEAEAANRIGLLADRAGAAIARLRHRRRHRAILAGVAGFYLSAPTAGSEYARPIRGRLLESLDPTVRLIIAARRLRRHG
jgi:tetraprenyl-beta-curcumene synthase